MSEKKRVLLLVLIMAAACLIATAVTIAVLYRTAFEEQREILVAIARNHARLIEEAAGMADGQSLEISGETEQDLLETIIHLHTHFEGIGHTGEFSLAKLDGDRIVFLLDHRYREFKSDPIPMKGSKLAEPMRRALLGQSGSMVGLDYRGVKVLAAHEAIPDLHWGIVAKVDLAELRIPFARAGALALGIAAIAVLLGALFFLRITHPIIARLREHSQHLAELVSTLRQSEEDLRRARDELEARVEERTANLVWANKQLEVEARKRARVEERLRALWTIAQLTDADVDALCDHVLQGTLRMTHSRYAFYGFLDAAESVMSIYSWSKDALADCRMPDTSRQYPVAGAGFWAEAIRQRRVLVVNDYRADHPKKKGIPAGHVPITRFLAVPVFGQGRILAVVVAANKDSDYDDEDVRQLEAYASGVQLIIDRRRVESALRTSEKECRMLSRQVIEAQEKERRRLAREIHDGIGQSLAALKYRAEGYARKAGNLTQDNRSDLQNFNEMVRELMDEVRRIQNDLRPAHLDMLGLLETMEDFCRKFQATYTGIRTDLQIDLKEEDIPDYLKTPVFRIFQEAMNNAAKHSRAAKIRVRILHNGNGIRLEVTDDGEGFKPEDGLAANGQGLGLGLFSMRERAELSGGTLELQSEPGAGTTVSVSWPLQEARPA